jgi:hypothetical protein
MLEFTSSDVAADDHGIKACLYARSGIGKTVLAATCPRPLIIAAEPGFLSLKKANLERIFGVGNPNITYSIPIIKITTADDLAQVHLWLTQSAEAKNFDTIYTDSISEVGEVVLANAKAVNVDGRKAYGVLYEDVILKLKQLRDISGKHVIFVAKQDAAADEVSKITSYGPMMPGKALRQGMPYLFDEVFRLGLAKTPEGLEYRFLQTRPDLQYEAKDRSGVLDAVEPPDLGLVIKKILARK